jgi:hypothetical protein
MKEDAVKKGPPVPNEVTIRELVLAKVEAPDLATVKDFLCF